MDIIFTEYFDNEIGKKYFVTRDSVKETINNPKKSQDVKFDELFLKFYIGHEVQHSVFLLVITKLEARRSTIAFDIPVNPFPNITVASFLFKG